jgi:hypothetical protein
MTIFQYTILSEATAEDLAKQVNGMLRTGKWQPVGGLVLYQAEPSNILFMQAMGQTTEV